MTEMTGIIPCGETTRLNHPTARVPEGSMTIDPLAITEMTATAANHLAATTTEVSTGHLVPPVVSTVHVQAHRLVSVARDVGTAQRRNLIHPIGNILIGSTPQTLATHLIVRTHAENDFLLARRHLTIGTDTPVRLPRYTSIVNCALVRLKQSS